MIEDLASLVFSGVIMLALVYAWNVVKRIWAITHQPAISKRVFVYDIFGPLFFRFIADLRTLFDVANYLEIVIIDFTGS